jgi:hypothetical protein
MMTLQVREEVARGECPGIADWTICQARCKRKGGHEVHLSHTFAGQESKSVFVEISERSAKTARLLQEARQAQPAEPPEQTRSLAGRAASQWVRLLQHVGKRFAPRESEAPG